MKRRQFLETLAASTGLVTLLGGIRGNAQAAPPHPQEQDTVSPNRPTLWYREAAKKWTEALPVGNGRLGAMIFRRYR